MDIKKTTSRKGPSASATLYKVGTKKQGNDGNIWIVIELANGVKRWKLFKKPTKLKTKTKSKTKTVKPVKSIKPTKLKTKSTKKFRLKKLGFLFLIFMDESNDDAFPKSPSDVKNLDSDMKELWDTLKKLDLIETIDENKFTEETYYTKGDIVYVINVLAEIAGRGKYFYEPRKLKEESKQTIINMLIDNDFIE